MQNRNLKIAATILLGLTAPLWWLVDWWKASDVHGRIGAILFVAAWAFVIWGEFQEDARRADALAFAASPAGQATMQAMSDARVAEDLADSGYALDENGKMVALEMVALPTWEAEPPGAKLIRLLNEGVPLETAQAQVHGSGHPQEYVFEVPVMGPMSAAPIEAAPAHPCAQRWWPEIVAAGKKHNVDPLLILEVMGNESACQQRALSPVGAVGLVQVMPGTAAEIARGCGEDASRLWEPGTNLSLGACYLKMMADQLTGGDMLARDSVFWIAAAYNCGPGCAGPSMRGQRNLPAETIPYANAIADAYMRSR